MNDMDNTTIAQGGVRDILTKEQEAGQVERKCEDELQKYMDEGNLTVLTNNNEYNNPLI